MRRLHSDDGVAFKRLDCGYVPPVGQAVRDPSVIYRNGAYWCVYTAKAFQEATAFGLARSEAGAAWSHVTNPDCSAVMTGGSDNRIGAADWFEDPTDGSIGTTFCAGSEGNSGPFRLFWIEPTDSSGFTTWGAAQAIGGLESVEAIDPCMIYDAGSPHPYKIFWKRPAAPYCIGYAKSAAKLTGYTVVIDGSADTFGKGEMEGPQPVRTATGWRIYGTDGGGGPLRYFDLDANFANPGLPVPLTSSGDGTAFELEHGTVMRSP